MIHGIELWPDQADDRPIAQADLDLLVEVTQDVGDVLLKVRWFNPTHLRQLADAVHGAWFVTRPTEEGYTATEIAAGITRSLVGFRRAGLAARWLCHETANEPNHPDGPFGRDGAERFALVLQEARRLLALVDIANVPLGSPSLVPYHGTASWARALSRTVWQWRCAHDYWQGERIEDGISDALAQTDGADPARVIVTEVGDATVGDGLPVRAARTATALRRLSERGVHGACLFILRAPGWQHYELGPGVFNQMLRTAGGVTVPIRMGFKVGEGVAQVLDELGDEPTSDEVWENPRTFSTTFARRHVLFWNPASAEVVVVERTR